MEGGFGQDLFVSVGAGLALGLILGISSGKSTSMLGWLVGAAGAVFVSIGATAVVELLVAVVKAATVSAGTGLLLERVGWTFCLLRTAMVMPAATAKAPAVPPII